MDGQFPRSPLDKQKKPVKQPRINEQKSIITLLPLNYRESTILHKIINKGTKSKNEETDTQQMLIKSCYSLFLLVVDFVCAVAKIYFI